jgi:hypothetical protein
MRGVIREKPRAAEGARRVEAQPRSVLPSPVTVTPYTLFSLSIRARFRSVARPYPLNRGSPTPRPTGEVHAEPLAGEHRLGQRVPGDHVADGRSSGIIDGEGDGRE